MNSRILLADENIPLSVVRVLRESGYQVDAVTESSPGLSDAQVLARACALNAIILTFDRDFGTLIFRNGHTSPRSIIYLRSIPESVAELPGLIMKLLEGAIVGEVDGHMIVWTRTGTRKRTFPTRTR